MCKQIGGDVLFFIRKGRADDISTAMKWYKDGNV